MKLILVPKLFSLVLIFSMTSFTIPEPPPSFEFDAITENCEMSIQSKVKYGVQRKMVDGKAFSNAQINTNDLKKSNYTNGVLEVCVSPKVGCKWNLVSEGNHAEKNISIEFKGLEEVVKSLNLSSAQNTASANDFMKIAKSNGAEISDLGNGAMSIRQINTATNLTTVTLVDTKQGVIMGSSVYGDGNQLKAKMICKYKGANATQAIHTLSLLVFEHAMGDKSGWMTEIIACY